MMCVQTFKSRRLLAKIAIKSHKTFENIILVLIVGCVQFVIKFTFVPRHLFLGRMEQESGWDKPRKLVVTLPNGTTKTIGISQGTQKRYWFGICPVSSKIGNLKMCGGCKMVGYVGKEEQV